MSFLDDYASFTSSLEIPEIFSSWCAYSALAAAAQRKIWYGHGKGDAQDLFKVTPNLYIILVAPAGRCGKSTSMEIEQDLLISIEEIKTCSDYTTKESIVDNLSKASQRYIFPTDPNKILIHSSMTLFANEMSVLIKSRDKDTVAFLTSLYDCKPVFKYNTKDETKKRIVPLPYLNLLGGTTPDWIRANVHEDILEGGLLARALPIMQETCSKLNPFPYMTEVQVQARSRVIKRLAEITKLGGRYRLTDSAITFYETWYNEHHKHEPPDNRISGYWWRKRIHCLKLALLNAVADTNDPFVTEEHLQMAFNQLLLTEPCMMEALSGVGRNEMGPIIQDILEQVKRAGKVKTADLFGMNLWALKNGEKEFSEVISVLTKLEEITSYAEDGTTWTKYIGKEKKK